MNKHVYWLLELDIQSGREEDFRTLMDEMVTATKEDEPGTLGYEWSTSEDGRKCHIFESYEDSAATLQHLANFGEKFAARFLEVLSPTSFVVYGAPSQEVRDALAAFGASYMQSVGGFTR
ncbi:MAG: antibiotic biosynthesis monooxygenase [Xanthomonadales bacterium]|nr:antibiotic biosynthesis monooxygenase [Xanthomonadales bacterium]